MLLDAHALHCLRIAGLIAVKRLPNAMLSTVPRAIHSVSRLAGRDDTRGSSVGAGNDFAGSRSAASSAWKCKLPRSVADPVWRTEVAERPVQPW